MLLLFAVRGYEGARTPPLEPWHIHVPRELVADEIDGTDWQGYLEAERRIFSEAHRYLSRHVDGTDRVASNRYFSGSAIHPESFAQNWNHSYVLLPDGKTLGAAVLLHGLTDSPYSLRHIARYYQQLGFVAVGIRLPGHGTVPGGLTDVEWEAWMAAAALAVREAKRLGGEQTPLHLIGFSNGAALALKYALDSLSDPRLARAQQIVLISPMIGVSAHARFAGLAGLPAILPSFAKAAWLKVLPEFNPFKYNSFPVNGARQAYRLSRALQKSIAAHAKADRLADFPPVLAFQSVMDDTVNVGAVTSALYDHLPGNGSELVVFDLNRAAYLGPLLKPRAVATLDQLFPSMERNFRLTMITNAAPGSTETVEQTIAAGERQARRIPLEEDYPADIFSLSHVALPFPMSDSLYGRHPDTTEFFGIHLGTLALRGERDVLIVSQDDLGRIMSNPFFPYLLRRIGEQIGMGFSSKKARNS